MQFLHKNTSKFDQTVALHTNMSAPVKKASVASVSSTASASSGSEGRKPTGMVRPKAWDEAVEEGATEFA